jgi:hypothetical protein
MSEEETIKIPSSSSRKIAMSPMDGSREAVLMISFGLFGNQKSLRKLDVLSPSNMKRIINRK